MKGTLFCLEQCSKCDRVKELIEDNGIKIVNFPHNFVNWSKEDDKKAKENNVFVDLQTTAPILVLEDGTKIIGQLRIMRWLLNV